MNPVIGNNGIKGHGRVPKIIRAAAVVLLACVLLFVIRIPAASAETADLSYTLEADKLKSLGLFKGTDIGYELDRTSNRAEAAIMLVRLLGGESEALMNRYGHPFTDVPEWADGYVGYLYEKGLTKGVGGNLFAPFSIVDAKSYMTFILRSLGYSEDEGDFSWENAVDDSLRLGITTAKETITLNGDTFNRGLMAAMSYNALNSPVKNGGFTLAASLAEDGHISAEAVEDGYFLKSKPYESIYLPYLEKGEYMPRVKGMDIKGALVELRKAGAGEVGIEYAYDEIVKEGFVISADYIPYVESMEGFKCTIVESLGPTLPYHDDLEIICEEKGWDDEAVPYVISAAKHIIKNSTLNKFDVYNRLKSNIGSIAIQDKETSAGMSYAAMYDAATGYLSVNRFVLSEKLILHEIAHALSRSFLADKVGFPNMAKNSRKVTEAYTAYIADSSVEGASGRLSVFDTGRGEIVFGGGGYFCDGPDNFTINVYEPLFILAGEANVDTMYFGDINKYSREVLDFNERYGSGRWQALWGLADVFIGESDDDDDEEREKMAEAYFQYVDGIVECLLTDLEAAGEDVQLLNAFLEKTAKMKLSVPLDANGYRDVFNELEKTAAERLGAADKVADEGYWKVFDHSGLTALEAYNRLVQLADASAVGYRVVESELEQGYCAGIMAVDPENTVDGGVDIVAGEMLETGGEYIIEIPAMPVTPGYSVMRDLVNDFGKYLADYSDMGNYIVGRILEGENIGYRYEYEYFDYVHPAMQGRIVGQFPAPGAAVIPGVTTVVIMMLREYQ